MFLNTGAESDAYTWFKEMFLGLTIDHFEHMREFILVRPTYYHRAQDYMSYNPLRCYLRQMTTYKGNCKELCEYLKMSEQDFVDILPQGVSKIEFPKLKPRKLSLEDHRVNV